MNNWLRAVVCVLALLCSPPLLAGPQERITGIYSDMEFNQEGGDVLGVEVFVMFSRKGYFVVFQDAEGSPSEPVVVPAKIKGDEITFELPHRNGYGGNFVGRIGGGELVGKFEFGQLSMSGHHELRLKRKASYWQ